MQAVSFSIIQTPGNVGAEIRSGDTVALKVIRPLAGGKWQVSFGGKLLAIRSTVNLVPGQWIHTRAQVNGRNVILHLLSISDSRLPNNGGAVVSGSHPGGESVLLQAFRRAGLHVDNQLLEGAKTVFDNARRKTRTTASVIAALAEKHISPETGFVDYITGVLENPDNRRRKNTDREGEGKGKPSLSDVESIREKLKSHIERSAGEDGLLQLFNHVTGGGESWVLIPYAIRERNREVTGVIRLRINREGRIRRVGIDASTQDALFTCSLDWPIAESSPVKVGCSDKKLLKVFVERSNELPQKLRNLVSISDDNSIEDEGLDFLNLEPARFLDGVNEFA